MDASIKHCVITACVGGGWYPEGQKRLIRSLYYHGSTADILAYQDEWPSDGYNTECPYNIKASVLEKAIELGYKRILWLDSSVWCVQYPMGLWDIINHEGYYFWRSGYNCAQVCSDKCLEYFGVDRDTAEKYQDCSTSMFGLNMDNPEAQEFARRWIQSAKDGQFEGSRFHDNQSEDPRFIAHRQDQSCASMIIGQMGLKMHLPNVYSAVYQPDLPSSVIYVMKGI